MLAIWPAAIGCRVLNEKARTEYFDLQTLQEQFFLAQHFLAELARKIVQFLIADEFSLARQVRLLKVFNPVLALLGFLVSVP